MKVLLLCAFLLGMSVNANAQLTGNTYNAIGVNYMLWYVPEGYAADHHSYFLEWRQVKYDGWYVRPHAKVGFGHYWSWSDVSGEKFLDDRYRKVLAGFGVGIAKKYLGLRLTNDIGRIKYLVWNESYFLTFHELSIHSGHALKWVECSINVPFYLVTVGGFASMGFINTSLLFKF